MRLVSIDNEAEQNFVTSHFGGEFAYPWLGAKKVTWTETLTRQSFTVHAWKWSWVNNNMTTPDSVWFPEHSSNYQAWGTWSDGTMEPN